MGWSFRRSKSFGLFKLNLSKSGIGFSFGVAGARVGVNSKGKKYVRGGGGSPAPDSTTSPHCRMLSSFSRVRLPLPASRRVAF